MLSQLPFLHRVSPLKCLLEFPVAFRVTVAALRQNSVPFLPPCEHLTQVGSNPPSGHSPLSQHPAEGSSVLPPSSQTVSILCHPVTVGLFVFLFCLVIINFCYPRNQFQTPFLRYYYANTWFIKS